MIRTLLMILIPAFLLAQSVAAFEISDVALKPQNIRKYDVLKSLDRHWADGCTIAKDAKPKTLSLQTSLLYDKPELYEQIMGKVEKAHVNIKCAENISSVLYFKFSDANAANVSLGFIKGLIWGEGGRSKRHPERIAKYTNIIAIFSSAEPGMIDYLQLGKIIYSDVPAEIISGIRKRNSCDKPENTPYCQVLEQIAAYKAVAFPKAFEQGVFAKIWSLKDGAVTAQSYMYGKVQDGKIGLVDVRPDNDNEKAEMDSMMKGESAPTKELLGFIATLKIPYADLEKYQGSYRTLKHGNLLSLYPVGKKVYFIVTADHFSDEPGTTIVGYFLLP